MALDKFQATNNAYLVLEIWGHKYVSELQPMTHVWYLEFWATKLCHTSTDVASFVFNTSGHTYIATRTIIYFTSAFLPRNTNPLGSQGDST